MDYTEFEHSKIEKIADKFSRGEFVICDELNLWYDYKKAVTSFIANGEYWETHPNQDSEIVQKILKDIADAKSELTWIRSIPTYNLQKVCEYYVLEYTYCNHTPGDNPLVVAMAQRVLEGNLSKNEEQLIRELLEETNSITTVENVRNLTTPVHLRNWSRSYNRATEYCPAETPMDSTELYDGREHYVYIQGETEGRWGDTYWISVDCDNSLGALPVIKDFKNYDFQVGGFYKITCTDTIYFGRNKKKYVMDIRESTEEEFMEKGFIAYATREY